jgi:hypothetical protein
MADPLDQWRALSDAVFTDLVTWRTHQPQAPLTTIEAALDERLARLRAQMLQDLALQSAATDWAAQPPEQRPHCPACDHPLQARGTHIRHLQTDGGQELALARQYGTCPACGAGLFPPR